MTSRFFHFAIAAVLLAPFLAQAQTSAPQSESNNSAAARRAAEIGNGKWWLSLTDEARDKFIERYRKVWSDLAAECARELKCLARLSETPLSCADEIVDMGSTIELCRVAGGVSDSLQSPVNTHKELREGLDEFYKDPANLTIPIRFALQDVRGALLIKHLRQARQKSASPSREGSYESEKSGETLKQD